MFIEFSFGTHTKHATGKLLSVIQGSVMQEVKTAFSLLLPVKHLIVFNLRGVISTKKN